MKVTKVLSIFAVASVLAFASCSTTKAEEVVPAETTTETTVEMAEIVPAEEVATPEAEVETPATETVTE